MMIRVNLLSGNRGARRKGFSMALPRRRQGGGARPARRDAWTTVAAVALLASLGVGAWFFTRVAGRSDDLTVQIQESVRDSIRYADLIADATTLQARRDTLAHRVALIQEIDGARYVWSHILDEVARAVPEYTWLTQVRQVSAGPTPGFRIEGRSGNTFALTRFLSNLGDSPFFRDVALISASQVAERDPSGRAEQVQRFTIDAAYRNPPPELLQVVPLFAPGLGSGDGL